MATPIIDNFLLLGSRILVLPDEDSQTTGTIFCKSTEGGGQFGVSSEGLTVRSDHVLFVKEMSTIVEIDGVEYMAMHCNAVVGLIPD